MSTIRNCVIYFAKGIKWKTLSLIIYWSSHFLHLLTYLSQFHNLTRKSSCVNARGIPTAAYEALYLLSKLGYPPPAGVPPASSDLGYMRWGTRWHGYPPWPGLMGGYLRWGTPQPCGVHPPPAGPDQGTPPADRQMDGWTDTSQNITFRSYYVRGR